MRKIFSLQNPIVIIGLLISVTLSIALVMIGQDTVLSLVVGLLTSIISLLLEIIDKFQKAEEKIDLALTIQQQTANKPWLYEILCLLTQSYTSIEKLNFQLFEDRAREILLNCKEDFQNLARGFSVVNARSNFVYGTQGTIDAKKSIKATVLINPEYFYNSYGEIYVENIKKAVRRGIDVVRIWPISMETLLKYQDLLIDQEKEGLKTLIAMIDEVPPRLLADYMIYDDKTLVKLDLDTEGFDKLERISVDPIEVSRAVKDFEFLMRYTRSLDDVLRMNEKKIDFSFPSMYK